MWRVSRVRAAGSSARFSALTLGFFDVAQGLARVRKRFECFSALTLGFFDVASAWAARRAAFWRFSALTLGFFDVASRRRVFWCRSFRFSALTLGFFDVARLAQLDRDIAGEFQCPNAGLLRCGSTCRVERHPA